MIKYRFKQAKEACMIVKWRHLNLVPICKENQLAIQWETDIFWTLKGSNKLRI